MVVKREQYVDNLVGSMHNGLIKVVTGIRRCGKSFLLNELFRKRLQEMEIKEDNISSCRMFGVALRRICNPTQLSIRICNPHNYHL